MAHDQPGRSAETDLTPPLLIRADASPQIGTGHVMRCLALAQAWQAEGGSVTLVAHDLPHNLRARLATEGVQVRESAPAIGSADDAAHALAVAGALGARHAVIDGYHFGAAYQRQLKAAGLRLLMLDDNGHAEHYAADLVLNQNIHAHEGLYARREPDTELLLGTRYALLRREFWPWRDWQREVPPTARKLLVTLGGSDPDNVTLRVIQALAQVRQDDLEVRVIVGGSNPHIASLEAGGVEAAPRVTLVRDVSDMPGLMAWADVAISAAGSTCWELAFMRLPSLLIVLAENQRQIAAHMAQAGAALNLGQGGELTPARLADALLEVLGSAEQRRALMARSADLVDGAGARRVVAALQTPLRLRRATPEDCRAVWELANDPTIRAASFSSAPIPWEAHVGWYARQLASPEALFLLAENEQGALVGQVRFVLNAGEAVISVSLAAAFRGAGLGARLIQLGSQALFRETDAARIHAYIKADNRASITVFTRAGYRLLPPTVLADAPAAHMLLER